MSLGLNNEPVVRRSELRSWCMLEYEFYCRAMKRRQHECEEAGLSVCADRTWNYWAGMGDAFARIATKGGEQHSYFQG